MTTIAQQINLFGEIEPLKISIKDAAIHLGVSAATIRNWIKTGYLKKTGRNYVTVESLEKFQREIAGCNKLIKRANKSRKDWHDHTELTSLFVEKIKNDKYFSIDELGREYEKSLSDSFRNKEGIYYTPDDIVFDLIDLSGKDLRNATFCDPCCGSGNFVVAALSLGIKPSNIFAYDVDPVAIEITRERIYRKTGYRSNNIILVDFLELVLSGKCETFDYIFTNPPWGKKYNKEYKDRLSVHFDIKSSLDSSSLFFFACMQSLRDNGFLGLLLPESFFNIAVFEEARCNALKYKIKRVIDYGKPFKGLVTKAQGIVLEKSYGDKKDLVCCTYNNNEFQRKIGSFQGNPKRIINLYCTNEDDEVISHVFSLPYITLKGHAKWALGIVTGNNKKFIINTPRKGYIPVYKGSDITKSGLKPVSCFIPSDLSIYQQVAPIEFYHAEEKIVYKFISSQLCFFYDIHKRFFLNSANILIPEREFPVKMKVLGDVLSSQFMNWLFKRLFNTHKILRGDLESLPIHSQYLAGDVFDEDEYIENLGLERMGNGAFRVKK